LSIDKYHGVVKWFKKFFKLFLFIYIFISIFVKEKKIKLNSMRQLTNMTSPMNQLNWNEQPMHICLDDTDVG